MWSILSPCLPSLLYSVVELSSADPYRNTVTVDNYGSCSAAISHPLPGNNEDETCIGARKYEI